MKETRSLENFKRELEAFDKTIEWCQDTFKKAKQINLNKTSFTKRELEVVDLFLARFSRSVDMFINRVLRSLDVLELEDKNMKTTLDIIIGAEKRGIVEDYRTIVNLRDLRNKIAHEYIWERNLELKETFKKALEQMHVLLEISHNLKQYAANKGYIT